MEKWNFQKVGMPEFDGQYLCYISQKQECGPFHKAKVQLTTSAQLLQNRC